MEKIRMNNIEQKVGFYYVSRVYFQNQALDVAGGQIVETRVCIN